MLNLQNSVSSPLGGIPPVRTLHSPQSGSCTAVQLRGTVKPFSIPGSQRQGSKQAALSAAALTSLHPSAVACIAPQSVPQTGAVYYKPITKSKSSLGS